MAWRVSYHPKVHNDFLEIGKAEAITIKRVIDQRIGNGEPDKLGKPLLGELRNYRRLRTGQMRIVYRVNKGLIEVLIIAVGMRRDDEVYEKAISRLD